MVRANDYISGKYLASVPLYALISNYFRRVPKIPLGNHKKPANKRGNACIYFLSFRSVRNSMTDAQYSEDLADVAIRTAFAWILPFLSSVDCRNVPVVSKGWNAAFSKPCKAALSERGGPAERNLVRWAVGELYSLVAEMREESVEAAFEFPADSVGALRRGDWVFVLISGNSPRVYSLTLRGGGKRRAFNLDAKRYTERIWTGGSCISLLDATPMGMPVWPTKLEWRLATFLGRCGKIFPFRDGACTISAQPDPFERCNFRLNEFGHLRIKQLPPVGILWRSSTLKPWKKADIVAPPPKKNVRKRKMQASGAKKAKKKKVER